MLRRSVIELLNKYLAVVEGCIAVGFVVDNFGAPNISAI